MEYLAEKKGFKLYAPLCMLYSVLLIVSVLLPLKVINLFGLSEPGGILIFPTTYLLSGVVAEVYGRKLAVKMVISSILCLMLFNFLTYLIVMIPSAKIAPPHQEAYTLVFSHAPKLFLGCLVGLICSDLTNVYRLTRLKIIFKGKYFWQRCLWTTAISELLFNFFCYSITYYNSLNHYAIFKLMINSWLLKMIYSLLMIFPLLYFMIFLKKYEGCDIYDVKNSSGNNVIELKLIKALKGSSLKKE
ncbi:MAG: queuosine precursor transporter [Legionellales bacterium]|nr:queuosine precursor transporter [Legionellales bacterium]